MDNKSIKKMILDYMASQKMAVVSTLSTSGGIESAAVAFSQTDRLEVIFQTPKTTRKYQNLQNNSQVAVVIGWGLTELITIQYEGISHEIPENEVEPYRVAHANKNEFSRPYAFLPENRYFKVTPKWIRYSRLLSHPAEIYVLEF